jgi:hypothetical protein
MKENIISIRFSSKITSFLTVFSSRNGGRFGKEWWGGRMGDRERSVEELTRVVVDKFLVQIQFNKVTRFIFSRMEFHDH